MRYLVVVAHPDDEVLGVGATIKKLVSEGNEVAVSIMVGKAAARANISESLQSETDHVLKLLGVKKKYMADFPNIQMNTVPHLQLVQFVEKCIEDFSAEAIITHHPSDTNNDHVMTSQAVQAACRLFQRKEGVPALKEVMFMEVLSSTEWALDSSNRFVPNCYMEIGKCGVDEKIKLLELYKGVMRPYPHPRSAEAIIGLAAYRGAQAGCDYAEAFECVFRRLG